MDWEQFKKDVAHLNKSRTPEERSQLIKSQGLRSWKDIRAAIPTVIRKGSLTDGSYSVSPARLETLAGACVKKHLYLKFYIDIIEHITLGEGIHPKIWDPYASSLKDSLTEVQTFNSEALFKWALKNYNEERGNKVADKFQKLKI